MQVDHSITTKDLLALFQQKLSKGIVEEQDLKEMRKRCTEGKQEQTVIASVVIPNFSALINRILDDIKSKRNEKKESFLLQLLNNLVTNNQQTGNQVYNKFTHLSAQTVKELLLLFTDTEKNRRLLLTFTYNMLYQLLQTVTWKQLTSDANLASLIYLLISEIYGLQEQAAFEWRTMIVVLLFNWRKTDDESTFEYLMKSKIKHHILIHTTSMLLQKVIDSRTMSTLVRGYQSSIKDINDMYKENKLSLSFALNKADVLLLSDKFIEMLQKFKHSFALLTTKGENRQQFVDSFQQLNDIMQLFGNLLFLGGYNNKLQELFAPFVPFACQYFRIIYLLFTLTDKEYKQQTLKNPHHEKDQESKYQALRGIIGQKSISPTDLLDVYNSLQTKEMLPLVLKFLTNFIHINPQGIQYFEQNSDVFYSVLNLTKISTTQPTMRQWSIMFIRNCCEMSKNLQDKIGDLKVELKI